MHPTRSKKAARRMNGLPLLCILRRFISLGLKPLINPSEDRLPPETGVLGSEDEVSLIGEVEEFGWNVLSLERGEHLETLFHGHPEILFAVNDEGRRDEVLDVAKGCPSVVVLGVVVGRSVELPLGEPEFFGGPVKGNRVGDAGVGDETFETIGVAGYPVYHVTPERSARGRYLFGMNEGIFLEDVVQSLDDIAVRAAAPLFGDGIAEFLTVPLGTAEVDHGDDVSAGGKHLGIPPVVELIFPGSLGSSVDEQDDGVFLRRVEERRFHK